MRKSISPLRSALGTCLSKSQGGTLVQVPMPTYDDSTVPHNKIVNEKILEKHSLTFAG